SSSSPASRWPDSTTPSLQPGLPQLCQPGLFADGHRRCQKHDAGQFFVPPLGYPYQAWGYLGQERQDSTLCMGATDCAFTGLDTLAAVSSWMNLSDASCHDKS